MATVINVDGKQVILPGVYASTKSGIINEPTNQAASFGNLVFIDTDTSSNSSAGGAGILSGSDPSTAVNNGDSAVYAFTSSEDLKSFLRRGQIFGMADLFFNPTGNATTNGVNTFFYVKAQLTTPAATPLFDYLNPVTFDTASWQVVTKEEGVFANSQIDINSKLNTGYQIQVLPGPIANSFYFEFYVGKYSGADSNTLEYAQDGSKVTSTPDPLLLFRTPAFTRLQQLIEYLQNNTVFNNYFNLLYSGVSDITPIPLTEFFLYAQSIEFTGGTATSTAAAFDAALEQLNNIDATFIMTSALPSSSGNSLGVNLTKIKYYIENTSRFSQFLIVPGEVINLSAAKQLAGIINSNKVILVYGGFKKSFPGWYGLRTFNALGKAAMVVGRLAGIIPSNPITFKSLDIKAEVNVLSASEQAEALQAGILYTFRDQELGFVSGQGVNTLQRNQYLVNTDGSSYSIQLERVKADLNKNIVVQFKRDFFGREEGVNRGNASAEDVYTWTASFLKKQITDGNILDFRNITVNYEQDNCYVKYEFIPNFEINKFVFSGTMLDSFN